MRSVSSYISMLERGFNQPSSSTILNLAEALRIAATDLVADSVAVLVSGRP